MMRGFTMYDKDGTAYKPSLGQNPSSSWQRQILEML
jgi:hypothetical protein